jgi:DNA-binding transcriptional ArsR family regulator
MAASARLGDTVETEVNARVGGRALRHDAPSAPTVEIDSSPLYELLLSLLIYGHEGYGQTLQVGPQWFASVRSLASPTLLTTLQELAPPEWFWQRLLILAFRTREGDRTVHCEEFIDRVRVMEPDPLFAFLLGGTNSDGSADWDLLAQAREGSRIARLRLIRVLDSDDPLNDESLARLLQFTPSQVKAMLLKVLTHWYLELFRQDERELAVRLASEARTKRIIGSSSAARLLRAAAPGVHYLPGRTVRKIYLAPSIICRPCLVTIRFDSTRLFFYPLMEETSEEDELSARLVKIYGALADPIRLQILRLLLKSERTVGSLSESLHQPRSTLGIHLVVLRDAGLITLRIDERREVFEIRPNLPSVIFRNLQAFLAETH